MRGVPQPTCAVDGCQARAYRKFPWCHKHQMRWQTHGDPEVSVVWLDAVPLLKAFDARCAPANAVYDSRPTVREVLPDPADQRMLSRVRKVGRVTECAADRLAVRGLGLTVDEVYGLEAFQGVCA